MREIKLSKGKVAIVDDCDFEELSKFKWHYSEERSHGYAARHIFENGKVVKIRMHRQILNAPPYFWVDHIDGDGLNNQRGNLRLATVSDNMKNRKPRGSSRFMGVSSHPSGWVARINIAGKQKHLGSFKNEVDAAKAYDLAAKSTGNPFYRLNFK